MDIANLIYNHIKSFPSRYFYTNGTIPTLGKVRTKKIVIITRIIYKYNNITIGNKIFHGVIWVIVKGITIIRIVVQK